MKIEKLRVNHLETPMGYDTEQLVFSWVVTQATGTSQKWARIRVATDENMQQTVYDSNEQTDAKSVGYQATFAQLPCTRYYWTVEVCANDGECTVSEPSWFETGKGAKGIEGQWIQAPFHHWIQPAFQKNLRVSKAVKEARVYATALGLLEFYVNGEKAGDDYLAPFYTDYNNWLQYVTYDITSLIKKGENAVGALLGNGWYKGRFGFIDKLDALYGNQVQLRAEVRITYEDGTVESIGTDSSWQCAPSDIVSSSIYDGEVLDRTRRIARFATTGCDMSPFQPVKLGLGSGSVEPTPRLSPPLRIVQRCKPKKMLQTKKDEMVLDFGQVMTGWVEFDNHLPKGTTLLLQYGELLQDDCFYNENLRTAKQEFFYTSDGKKEHVRPHFTFYGFRYVKIVCDQKMDLKDFEGCVIHSDIDEIGQIETSNEKVNRLIANTKWGQKGNFVDVPTDCPQRDERMGWTGDAQAFCATASFHMYTPAFYRKYMKDMYMEQKQLNGSVPHVVPDILGQISRIMGNKNGQEHGSCAWGDAATVIPWTMYLFYGDVSLLEEQYDSMRQWVNYIRHIDITHCDNTYLWTHGFHFADWLALDNLEKGSSFGGTEPYYIASAYYYYSAYLTAMAAKALGKDSDAVFYNDLADHVKTAMQKTYFKPNGDLKLTNQTAYVLALYFGFAPEKGREKLTEKLKKKLEDNGRHLDTGFVGTAYICLLLSQVGLNDYAYTLLLNEDFPSWLYEVNMGATTVWERWNSVLPDGTISDTGMNSMNHYAYGAVAEWMYRHMCGINPVWEKPGFKQVILAPKPNDKLEWVKATYDSASGRYVSGWKMKKDKVVCQVEVPFDATACFKFPEGSSSFTVDGKGVRKDEVELLPGTHEMTFQMKK